MPIRTEVSMPTNYADSRFSATEQPQALPQIEQLNSFVGDLRIRATAILSGLRDMHIAAFGPHPEAVGDDKQPKSVGAVNVLRDQLHDVSDTLTACESVLREVRRII